MTKTTRRLTGVLAAVLTVSLVFPAGSAGAAKKPSLSKKSVTITKGKSKTIQVKNAAKAKITWKSNKPKIAKVKKKGKNACTITGIKAGSCTVSCKISTGKKPKTLKCNVKVKARKASTTPKPTPTATAVTTTSAPTATPVATASTPTPTATPEPTPQTILSTYRDIFPYMGNCLTSRQMQDEETMEYVKQNFNSFTLENEMKPDALLGYFPRTITKEQAKSKGYIIPDNYKEATVPEINFAQLDELLKKAHDNGLKMRGHTLLWHSQTPQWFFVENYEGGSPFEPSDSPVVSPDVMDARLEFYISTVMTHVMEKEIEIAGEAGSIVYAWDVVNEYLHRNAGGSIKSWVSVYGNMNFRPSYVKLAYQIAYQQLQAYGVQDTVTLFYNDFDTYLKPNTSDLLKLIDFINEDEEANICGGIGMQSHVDVDRPTIEQYESALQQFLATGLEVQVTELDVTINWDHLKTYTYKNEHQTNEDQAYYVRELMEMIINAQKNRDKSVSPKGITSFTIWGLYDDVSWRGGAQQGGNSRPTLFGTSIYDPKPSYDEFLAAADVWYQ